MEPASIIIAGISYLVGIGVAGGSQMYSDLHYLPAERRVRNAMHENQQIETSLKEQVERQNNLIKKLKEKEERILAAKLEYLNRLRGLKNR